MFFTCCSAVRSFLRELGLRPQRERERERAGRVNKENTTVLTMSYEFNVLVNYRVVGNVRNKLVLFMRFFKAGYFKTVELW